MRAVVVRDGSIVVEERPDPEPGRGQLLVRVASAGLNGADMLQRRGLYAAPPGVPDDMPGLEAAGEVAEVGPGARRFSVGDPVMAVVPGAGQAELVAVDEREAMPVPAGTGTVEAGGFPEAFTTAHDALFTQAGLSLAERVIVHGAGGGVGTAAVQLARCAGAAVSATYRHREHASRLADLGARPVDPSDVAAAGPFDIVLELVGAPNMAANLAGLATGGRVVVIGIGAGARAEIDLRALMAARGVVRASTLRSRSPEEKAAAARQVEAHVLPLLAAGEIGVPIAAAFGLEQAADAYERFASGGKFGKIVLVTGRDGLVGADT